MAWLICAGAFASNDDDNTIVIIGRRPSEADRSRITGQSTLIVPEDASRFESRNHLATESSVLVPENGRVSASGFVVPQVRGQDARLTDVYLEDILLQDPYSGLPLIEDLDLRAFGAMEIHRGLAPPEIPGLNPVGTLRYRLRPVVKNSYQSGLQLGQPFGYALWGLATHGSGAENSEDPIAVRVYGRFHQTDGKFKYYSDHSTPYNSADDAIRTRENNDQTAFQALPTLRWQIGPDTNLQIIAWGYSASRGLPSRTEALSSSAREQVKGGLGLARIERSVPRLGPFASAEFAVGVATSRDEKKTQDPDLALLEAADHAAMNVQSVRATLSALGKWDQGSVAVDLQGGQTKVKNVVGNRQAADLNRDSGIYSVGGSWRPGNCLVSEGKAQWRAHRDKVDHRAEVSRIDDGIDGGSNLGALSREAKGWGLSFGCEPDWLRNLLSEASGYQGGGAVYVQRAGVKRLPTLIEEFGDGSMVRPNGGIGSESLQHFEGGLSLHGQRNEMEGSILKSWRFGAALFKDETNDKIIFQAVSANSIRAENVRKTRVSGLEVNGEATLGLSTLMIGVSELEPIDVREWGGNRILPGVPEEVVVTGVEHRFDWFTLRWLSRYRSKVYRDLGNSVVLPSAWIHDCGIDTSTKQIWGAGKSGVRTFELGLSVRNVFDLKEIDISAPETTQNKGKTSLSDLEGAPLPGRQWLASLVAVF